MKTIFKTFAILCLVALVSVPVFSQRKNIPVSEFSRISMSRSGTVYVTQGNTTKVEVLASDDVIEDLDIEVRGNELLIKNKRTKGWGGSNGKLEVFVVTPDVEGFAVSGSGKIIAENKIKSSNLNLAISGSGRVISSVDAESIKIAISGSGNAELSGTSKSLSAAISGSGGVKAEDLFVDTCEVTISGSGNCEVHVNESIDARTSGSGSVRYHGNPQHINSKSSGSGSVKKVG